MRLVSDRLLLGSSSVGGAMAGIFSPVFLTMGAGDARGEGAAA